MADLMDMYSQLLAETSDMSIHLPKLRELAAEGRTAVEFGVRTGRSTVGILQAGVFLTSYDIAPCEEARKNIAPLAKGRWAFIQDDSVKVRIPRCDLLFIDSDHTYEHLRLELGLHESRVRRYIAMHDTYAHDNLPMAAGLRRAIGEFLDDHAAWEKCYESQESFGFTVLRRTE